MKGSSARVITLGVITIVLLVLAPASSNAAISCSDVLKDLRPCLSYLTSGSGMPPAACCGGAKALASSATTTADKKAACACLKSAAQQINPNPQLAQSLPANCGITLPVPITPNVDCSKIS